MDTGPRGYERGLSLSLLFFGIGLGIFIGAGLVDILGLDAYRWIHLWGSEISLAMFAVYAVLRFLSLRRGRRPEGD